jgi:hypothetical protein
MNAHDFYDIWLRSAINERIEAQNLRRYARRFNHSDILKRRAKDAYTRALFDLAQARRFRSEIHAN